MRDNDKIRVSTAVAAEPAVAFALFTDEVDLWWRRGPRYRLSMNPNCRMQFEAHQLGTCVTVEHRGWASLPADHPVRHGMEDVAFGNMMGKMWGELIVSLQRHVAKH